MRMTKPNVRLIARPEINWLEIQRYLETVGGDEWAERRQKEATEYADTGVGQDLIEFGGRLCYRSWKPGLNANVTKVRTDQRKYFDNLLASGHGSVLEHANYSFVFENVSRVFTHELCRHRAGAAYSQESMRFVRLTDIPFWFPDWIIEDQEFVAKAVDLLQHMEDFQKWMANYFRLDDEDVPFAEKKAKTSFMRRFAPDGVSTVIMGTFNIRALRHIITMRTDPAAEEEIRLVFEKVAHIMWDECPLLFGDFFDWTRDSHLLQPPTYRKV